MSLPNQLFRAGAGAGKTSTLIRTIEERALAFKAEHGNYPHLIVTTFTRKATQEIRERLLSRALERKDPEFLEFANSSQQVLISTIHGILNTFLNRYGHRFGLDPSLKIIDMRKERQLEYGALKQMMKTSPDLVELVELFGLKRLVQMLHDVVLKLQHLGKLEVYTEEALAAVFAKKLGEIELRLVALSQRVSSETVEGSWSKFLDGLRSTFAALKNRKLEEALVLLSETRKPSFTSKSKISAIADDEAKNLKDELKEICSDASFSPTAWKRHLAVTHQFLRAAHEFRSEISELKRKMGMISMTDLELRTLEALRADPDAATAFSREWDYWFIDEYQDTSPVQEEILEQLKGDRSSFVVGDPQQSIYLFRGARTEVFLRKESEFEKKNFEIARLENNYRSRKELVDFFNMYFGKLGRGFLPMYPQVHSESTIPPVTFLRSEDDRSENQNVANWVRHLISKGAAAEDICVLAKTNDIAWQVGESLKSVGVPYRLHASGGFGKRREVVDALVLLKFIVNPYDNLNLLCLLRSPFLRISDAKLAGLRSQEKNLWLKISKQNEFGELLEIRRLAEERGIFSAFTTSLQSLGYFEASNLIDDTGVRESNLFKLVANLRDSVAKPNFNYLTFIDELLSDTAVLSESDAIPAVEPKRVNIMTIHASKGLQFAHVIVPGFSKGKRKGARDNVIVDEESRILFLAIPNDEQSSDVIFPGHDWLDRFHAWEIEESHRLLYVAFTRAVESLFVSSQMKVEKNSWLESCPLDLDEGNHKEGYQVLSSVADVDLPSKNSEPEALEKLEVSSFDGIRKISVTNLLFQKDDVAITKMDVGLSLGRLRTGIELHNIFEKLSLGGTPEIPEEYQEAVNFVLENRDIPFREISSNGKAEFGIIYRFEGCRLEGKIDLWGISNGELWIVDYKTGASKNKEKAFQQLRIYSLPLMEWLGVKAAKVAVIYPLEEKVFVEKLQYGEKLKTELRELLAPLTAATTARFVGDREHQPEANI